MIPLHLHFIKLIYMTVEKLKRINKMFYIHTMDHCLALKKDILSHATIWMNLEDIKWNEVRTKRQVLSVWFHLCEVSKVVKSIRTESRVVVTNTRWGRNREMFNGETVLSGLQDEKFLEIWCKAVQHHWTVHLKLVKMVKFMLCGLRLFWAFSVLQQYWERFPIYPLSPHRHRLLH